MRAGAAEQVPVDDRHAGAPCPGLVGRRLAGRTGADDDEIELVHRGDSPRGRYGVRQRVTS